MIKLRMVKKADQVAQVRTLFQEYANTRKNDPALVHFPEEIENLPGEYSPPRGGIILAYCNGEPAGCIAFHKLEKNTCEMKRLYVSPLFRGKGIGRSLVKAILKRAQDMGYARMRLDSVPGMETAQDLYKSMGFYDIDAYRTNPNRGTKYYEIKFSTT